MTEPEGEIVLRTAVAKALFDHWRHPAQKGGAFDTSPPHVRNYWLEGAGRAIAAYHAAQPAAPDRDAVVEAEVERIIATAAIASYHAARAELKDTRLKAANIAPTPDPAVMRDYIIKLTAYWMDNPGWTELANEARGYVGALKGGAA